MDFSRQNYWWALYHSQQTFYLQVMDCFSAGDRIQDWALRNCCGVETTQVDRMQRSGEKKCSRLSRNASVLLEIYGWCWSKERFGRSL